MKKLLFLLLLTSCATVQKSGLLPEDELFITRKYAGEFIEYRHTRPERFGDPYLIWIKTTQEPVYGIISAYSKKCNFILGERLYIRRIYYRVGINGYWLYQIENNDYSYRLSKFQYEKKVLVQSWF